MDKHPVRIVIVIDAGPERIRATHTLMHRRDEVACEDLEQQIEEMRPIVREASDALAVKLGAYMAGQEPVLMERVEMKAGEEPKVTKMPFVKGDVIGGGRA